MLASRVLLCDCDALMKAANRNILARLLIIPLFPIFGINLFAADLEYDTGSLINLATIRGARASASENLRTDHPDAAFLLHPAEGEIRFDNNFGFCWWMIELPSAYNFSDLRLIFRDVITSVGLQIKVAYDPPADWTKVPSVASFAGPLAAGPPGQRIAELHFSPVKAKFFCIQFTGQNGGETGHGAGQPDLVISRLQLWGPNDPGIGPAISLAQSAWAGGSCTLHDCTTDAPADCQAAIDDNDPTPAAAENSIITFFAPGTPAAPVQQTPTPATFIVTLKNRARIVAVAYSATSPDRVEPRAQLRSSHPSSNQETIGPRRKDSRTYQAAPASKSRWINPRSPSASDSISSKFGIPGSIPSATLPKDTSRNYTSTANWFPPTSNSLRPSLARPVAESSITKAHPVRNLQLPQPIQGGTHGITWDGLDDSGAQLPPGRYEARITLDSTIYTNAGNIGNTAQPPTINQNPTQIDSVAADSDGNIYTADEWDEASQDFRKWDRDTGRHVFDAHGLIRSGNPNGLAYTIAVDDKFIYCATTSHTNHAQQHLRRFHLADGSPAPFPTAASGHILIHDNPDSEIRPDTPEPIAQLKRLPLRAMAVVGDKLFVADALASKILIFDRNTGAALGSFFVCLPVALTADSKGQLWIANDNGQISVFSEDGQQSHVAHTGFGQIRAMAFGPGDTLYVADVAAGKIMILSSSGQIRTFGQPAIPGDYVPDHFYQLTALCVDADGNLTVAQKLPVDGARLTRFSSDGKVIWDQLGGEFCNTGNISADHPDEIITQTLHRYIVNKQTAQWQFHGSVLGGDPQFIRWPHGPMRIQKLGDTEFIFQGYGDGLQVYRRQGDLFRLCSMFGCVNPLPDGTYRDAMTVPEDQRPPKHLWSWHDANGNGKVDPDDIDWVPSPNESAEWDNFGVSVDTHGNALLCDFNNSVIEVPMTGFDKMGNPIYDLFMRRTIIPPDPSPNPLLSDPIMAVRADDGTIYVQSRSKVFPAPDNSGSWMTGWMLARYDPNGNRLWYTRLPEACPGMDYIPGGGVMLVAMKWGKQGSDVYHYAPDGALIGITHPSAEFRGNGGIPDNTGSLSISRDPRDGILDVFVEDCIDNHFQWYRVDDRRKPTVRSQWLQLTAPGIPPHANN